MVYTLASSIRRLARTQARLLGKKGASRQLAARLDDSWQRLGWACLWSFQILIGCAFGLPTFFIIILQDCTFKAIVKHIYTLLRTSVASRRWRNICTCYVTVILWTGDPYPKMIVSSHFAFVFCTKSLL